MVSTSLFDWRECHRTPQHGSLVASTEFLCAHQIWKMDTAELTLCNVCAKHLAALLLTMQAKSLTGASSKSIFPANMSAVRINSMKCRGTKNPRNIQ